MNRSGAGAVFLSKGISSRRRKGVVCDSKSFGIKKSHAEHDGDEMIGCSRREGVVGDTKSLGKKKSRAEHDGRAENDGDEIIGCSRRKGVVCDTKSLEINKSRAEHDGDEMISNNNNTSNDQLLRSILLSLDLDFGNNSREYPQSQNIQKINQTISNRCPRRLSVSQMLFEASKEGTQIQAFEKISRRSSLPTGTFNNVEVMTEVKHTPDPVVIQANSNELPRRSSLTLCSRNNVEVSNEGTNPPPPTVNKASSSKFSRRSSLPTAPKESFEVAYTPAPPVKKASSNKFSRRSSLPTAPKEIFEEAYTPAPAMIKKFARRSSLQLPTNKCIDVTKKSTNTPACAVNQSHGTKFKRRSSLTIVTKKFFEVAKDITNMPVPVVMETDPELFTIIKDAPDSVEFEDIWNEEYEVDYCNDSNGTDETDFNNDGDIDYNYNCDIDYNNDGDYDAFLAEFDGRRFEC